MHPNTHWGRHNQKMDKKKRDKSLKSKEQIVKKRLYKEKEKARVKFMHAKIMANKKAQNSNKRR